MKSVWRSRTIYIGTVAAMSMLVAGFALASGSFSGFGSITVQGNQSGVVTANTIYSPGLSNSEYTIGANGAAGTCSANTNGGSASDVVVTAWVSGGAGGCSGVQDYVLQLTFTSAADLSAGTYTDEFVVSSDFGTASAMTTGAVSVVCTPSVAPATCNAVINIDTGIPTTATQPNVNSVEITVTGS
jgi:hypothetical protein